MSVLLRAHMFAVTFLLLQGCSAKSAPVFYPNQHYLDVGEVQAEVDQQYCMTLADHYVKEPNKYQQMMKDGAINAAIGAGAGAIAGAITKGNVGRSTGAGAAVGAIVTIAKDMMNSGKPSPTYENFVDYCLKKKGYEISGWN